MKRDVVGAVLAGGRSRRMGRDKALLDIDGSALVDRAAAVLAAVCDPVVLGVAQGRRYSDLSLCHVEDQRADSGPLAGLEAVLAWASPRPVLVLACDLPRVETSVVERLLIESDEALRVSSTSAWIARRGDRVQPLCGLYAPGCLAVFRELLDRGERGVLAAVAAIDSRQVCYDDFEPDPFLNVNTPADYVRAGGGVVAQ